MFPMKSIVRPVLVLFVKSIINSLQNELLYKLLIIKPQHNPLLNQLLIFVYKAIKCWNLTLVVKESTVMLISRFMTRLKLIKELLKTPLIFRWKNFLKSSNQANILIWTLKVRSMTIRQYWNIQLRMISNTVLIHLTLFWSVMI
jgi:hypothetical protein